MTKKCIYCNCEISENCVIDFCDICGEKVWGKKMLSTIKHNMETARSNGDLCHQSRFIEVDGGERIVF